MNIDRDGKMIFEKPPAVTADPRFQIVTVAARSASRQGWKFSSETWCKIWIAFGSIGVLTIACAFIWKLSADGTFSQMQWDSGAGLGSVLFLLAIYFLPTLVASRSPWVGGIAVLNLLFGWTVIVWLLCLFAAIASPKIQRPTS